jgi:hypothetical protein
LFPRIRKDFKEKSSISRRLRRGLFIAIKNSIKVARKEMTDKEFANACIRDLFVSTCSIVSGGVTQGFIHVPVLGYIIGSLLI